MAEIHSINPETKLKLYSNTGVWHIFVTGKRRCLCQSSMKRTDFSKNTPTVERTASETIEKKSNGLLGEISQHALKKISESCREAEN